jgi:glycosyltransferase involved in cell wall biosynthesis
VKTGTSKKILIIIPCYNEAENVERLLAQLKEVHIDSCLLTPLFINDCSRDNTLAKLREINANYLSNAVNLGIGGTVQLGFIYAMRNGYDFAVQMDGDGQHPPSQLHKLIGPLINDEADMIIGSRFIERDGFQSSAMRRFGINFFSRLNRFLTGIVIKDSTSGYRAYSSKAIAELVSYYPDEYPEPEALVYLANKKMRLREVPVTMSERQGGVSSIRRFSSIYYMVKVTLNTVFLHLKMKMNG